MPKIAETAAQYQAVWPGGMVSAPLPSMIPLREEFQKQELEPHIQKRTALYTQWETVTAPTPEQDPTEAGSYA